MIQPLDRYGKPRKKSFQSSVYRLMCKKEMKYDIGMVIHTIIITYKLHLIIALPLYVLLYMVVLKKKKK